MTLPCWQGKHLPSTTFQCQNQTGPSRDGLLMQTLVIHPSFLFPSIRVVVPAVFFWSNRTRDGAGTGKAKIPVINKFD